MPTIPGITSRDHTPVTLMIPNTTYREWVVAARESGHTIDTYLISTITIATRLKLLEGTQRLPLKGAAIDPILAEAIRKNSQGKPWEHKTELLLATPALTPNQPLPRQPDPTAIRSLHTDTAQQLMAHHGLPVRQPPKKIPYATISGETFTWNQTALILAIWDHAGPGWTGRKVIDHAATAGLPHRSVEPSLRQLIEQEHIEQRPNPGYIPAGSNRKARNQHRLNPALSAAIANNEVLAC